MYPDLSYIIHAIFGIEPDGPLSIVKTFGLFLVFAFLVSAWLLKLELKRKEKLGLYSSMKESKVIGKAPTVADIVPQGIFGFVLLFKLAAIWKYWDTFLYDPATVLLSKLGNFWMGLLGMAIFAGLKYYNLHRKKLHVPKKITKEISPHDRVWDITVVAAISGIIGAKLFAIFESADTFSQFLRSPIATLLSGSGLAIYGGLIVAFVVVILYIRRFNMNPIYTMDATAPSLIAGYGVGRMGCQFSGDGDWGIVNNAPTPDWWFLPDSFWSFTYPHNVINAGELIPGCQWEYCRVLSEPVYPAPIYEIAMAAVIFAILWSLRKRIRIPGVLFFIYVFFIGVERWFIEKIRVNDKIDLFGMQLTQAEIISFVLILLGIGGVLYLWKYSKKRYPK